MKLDYGTLLSPVPITLSIGVLRKPTLREISALDDMASFGKYMYYEYLLKMTPEIYYTELNKNDGDNYWDSLSLEEQDSISLYDIVGIDKVLCKSFLEMLDFFFVEPIIFQEGFFILLTDDLENIPENKFQEYIKGIITKDTFPQVLEIIQQICCIYEEKKNVEKAEFKNKLARQLFEKMLKAKKEEKKKTDINLTIPNIISSVSNRHSSINPTNVWELTVFQLLDSFNRTLTNTIYDIDSTRVAVWGDEKKSFNASLWYKNEYDKS